MYITQFYNQINFFITLINGGDFDKCGGDIDGVNFAVERFDFHSVYLITLFLSIGSWRSIYKDRGWGLDPINRFNPCLVIYFYVQYGLADELLRIVVGGYIIIAYIKGSDW